MASETVKKILEAEAESERKTAEARKRREDILNEAEGGSARAIQKKISEATSDSGKVKSEYNVKIEEYRKKAEAECDEQLEAIKLQADKNMDKAVSAIIDKFF